MCQASALEKWSVAPQDELAARSQAAAELQEAQAEISRLNAALADAQEAANGSSVQGKVLSAPHLVNSE